MPPYTQDWGNATGSETLIEAACRHLVKLAELSDAGCGDVLVFRMRDQGVAKHAGVLTSAAPGSKPGRHPEERAKRASKDGRAPHHEAPTLIHAQEGLGVVEIDLGLWWRRRAVAAFGFPDVTG